MPEIMPDAVNGLSDALVERARGARLLVACITVQGRSMRSGTLWRKDVVVASEQSFPDIDQTEVTWPMAPAGLLGSPGAILAQMLLLSD